MSCLFCCFPESLSGLSFFKDRTGLDWKGPIPPPFSHLTTQVIRLDRSGRDRSGREQAWLGQVWTGQVRTGTGLDGTGLDGTGLDGTGLDWTGLDGTGVLLITMGRTGRGGGIGLCNHDDHLRTGE